jgi:hypothetical protein
VFTDHTTVVLEGAGHFLQSDAPQDFAEAVRPWLTRETYTNETGRFDSGANALLAGSVRLQWAERM